MIDLPDIVGQDEAIARLERKIAAGRMPHAFCFTGPAGVGKRTTAEALAKVLLCENPSIGPNKGRLGGMENEEPIRLPCGTCPDCTMIAAAAHGDFHPIYKELARYHDDANVRNRVMQGLGIDVIRRFLIDPAGRSATRGRGKVFVVLEAELLSIAAQNALLKTLEEPPANVTIILISLRGEQLLPTTRSRCSLVRFGPLPTDFITRKLTEAQVDPKESQFWASFTGGSVGRALKLARAGMYEIKRDLLGRLAGLDAGGDVKLGEDLAGITDRLGETAVRQAKTQDGASLSKNLATRRASGAMLELIASVFSDALALSTGAERTLVHADQPREIRDIAGRFDPTELAEILEQLSRYERLLWRNVNAKIIWDNVVITCASAAALRV